MQVLNEIRPFRGDDFNSLKDFWYELRGSVTNLQANGGEGEIQCGSNVERLVSKLPITLRRQWGGYVHRMLKSNTKQMPEPNNKLVWS